MNDLIKKIRRCRKRVHVPLLRRVVMRLFRKRKKAEDEATYQALKLKFAVSEDKVNNLIQRLHKLRRSGLEVRRIRMLNERLNYMIGKLPDDVNPPEAVRIIRKYEEPVSLWSDWMPIPSKLTILVKGAPLVKLEVSAGSSRDEEPRWIVPYVDSEDPSRNLFVNIEKILRFFFIERKEFEFREFLHIRAILFEDIF